MDFELGKALDHIEEIMRLQLSTTSSMNKLLDYCEAVDSDSVRKNFQKLDFEDDTEKLGQWLEAVLSENPPSDKINGLWFGLFNPVLDNGETSCGLYISGSTKYDSNDPDWAVWDDDSYLPENQYANSKILHKIYRLLEENNILGDAEYVLCLGYACFAVSSICRSLGPKLLFGERSVRTIVVGFDSGDWVIVEV